MNILNTFLLFFLIVSNAFAQPSTSSPIVNFTEEDGSPSTFPHKVKFSNGSVTQNGDGSVSVGVGSTAPASSGGGWTDAGGAVHLITSTDNVGIGTSAPAQKFSVIGNQALSGAISQLGGSNGVSLSGSSGSLTIVGIGNTNNESAIFNLETTANRIALSSSTGVNSFDPVSMAIEMDSDFNIAFDTGQRASMGWETTGNDNFQLGLTLNSGASAGYFCMIENGDRNNANRSPSTLATDPTFRIYSSDAAVSTDYVEFSHNQDDAVITSGIGDIILNASSNVGIGTSTPAQKLDISGNINTNGRIGVGVTSSVDQVSVISNTTATSGNYSAVHADIIHNAASDGGTENTAGLAFTATAAGTHTHNLIYGLSGTVFNTGTNTVTAANGGQFIIENDGTGTITSGVGLNIAPVITSSGNITNFIGNQIASPTYSSSGKITGVNFGQYIFNLGNSSTANSAGIYIANQTGSAGLNASVLTEGGLAWFNYTQTSTANFQASTTGDTNALLVNAATNNIGIGTSGPSAKLEVVGDAYLNKTSGALIMKSPDGTCSSCGVSNLDVWTCTGITCP